MTLWKRRNVRQFVAAVMLLGLLCRGGFSAEPVEPVIPPQWLPPWDIPPLADRPLQIVHGLNRQLVFGPQSNVEQPPSDALPPDRLPMRYYVEHGLGGVVCNVDFRNYLQDETHWQTLIEGVKQCHRLGMVVWLYDEEGYPSGAAGGLVLAENPEFEALALAFDPQRDVPFLLRPAYEYTHASNNYYAVRRYANLLDDRAVRCFIEKTHEAYRERLGAYFGRTIQAVFTDEPSLVAVNIGQIPEPQRSGVRVVDPPDPAVQPLPCVPWCYDLPEQYRKRYGEDLGGQRGSLFQGHRAEDRRVRRQFWALVTDLVAERYFGALQQWCGKHQLASSGHTLHEESPLHQVPLEGSALAVLRRMDIPGLDMLSSDPAAVLSSGWLTAGLPASAARLSGSRRVMTEVSDFVQRVHQSKHVSLEQMQAAAAWQAAWDVTEFTLYYRPEDRSTEEYRAYGDFVGRLGGVLKPAVPEPEVLLYYPIWDLWAEYLPVADPLRLDSQTPRAQQLVGSFIELGRLLVRSQVPFTIIDHQGLAEARVERGRLVVGRQWYRAVLLPTGAELPQEASQVVEHFRRQGGTVSAEVPPSREAVLEALGPALRLSPGCDHVVLGRFRREGREILLLVNVGGAEYAGELVAEAAGRWAAMRPAAGTIDLLDDKAARRVVLRLAPLESVLLVCLPE